MHIQKRHFDPNPPVDPLWKYYRKQYGLNHQKVSPAPQRRRTSSPCILLNYDYLEEAQDKRNSLIYYNPSVPLPASYQVPPAAQPFFADSQQLYPLVILSSQGDNQDHVPPTTKEESSCDWRAFKIGAFIVFVFFVSVLAYVGYLIVKKYFVK